MARIGSLPDALGQATPSKSLPGAWWGIFNENALKDPPEGLLGIEMDLNALNNPPVDPNSRNRHPPEGSTAVFSASIAAAANTAVYTEKYGGRQNHLGENEELSEELADDDCSGYKSSEMNYREYYDSDGTGEGGIFRLMWTLMTTIMWI